MLREGYSRHRLPCYGFGEALTAILASAGAAAGTGGAAAGAGAATGAAAASAATAATATGLGTAGAAGAAAGLGGTASLGITGLGAGAAAGGAGAAGTVGTIGATAGVTAGAAPGAVAAGTAIGSALPSLGTLGTAASLVSGAGGATNSLVSAGQQRKAGKIAANQAAKQARAEQIGYQDRVRNVLALNTAGAAARGVAGDGSAASLMQTNLEGGQLDLANIAADANSAQRLFSTARKRARLGGYLGAGQSVFTGALNALTI